MKKYTVTVRAFDRISTRIIEAESEEEARERALADVHFSVEVTPR